MTDYQLWPATDGPSTASADAAVTAGTEWKTTRADLFLKGYRVFRGTTDVDCSDVATWAHDATTLVADSQTTFTPSGTGWQSVTLTAPYPAVAANTRYVTGVLFATHYTSTASYWSSGAGSAGIGDDNLSAPNPGASAGGQGKFVAGATLARPTENGNGGNFWVEPILSTTDGSDGGGDPAPDTGTISAQLYGSAVGDALAGRINWLTGTIKATLHTSSMTPNILTHTRVSDLTAEVATGQGYTQGTGQTLASKSLTFTAASAMTAHAVSTAYVVGDLVRPASSNGHVYRCLTAGTSGSTAPTWPTGNLGQVTDGTAVWGEFGRGVTTLSCGDVPFGGITGSALYLVLSDRTDPDAADQPLIGLITFSEASTGTTEFTYEPPANGLLHVPVF